jgi:hypothetical protein
MHEASRVSANVAEQQTRASPRLHVARKDAAHKVQNGNRFIPCKHRNPQSIFGFGHPEKYPRHPLRSPPMTYRAAKEHITEHVLNPRVARLVILMLYRWSGGNRDIRPVFLARIIAQVNQSRAGK